MRERYYPGLGMIPVGQWERLKATESRRSSLKAPMLIRDSMDAAQHPATGEMFESKAAFRAATKASGCVEVGNDPSWTKAQPKSEVGGVEEDIKRAIEQLS